MMLIQLQLWTPDDEQSEASLFHNNMKHVMMKGNWLHPETACMEHIVALCDL